MRDQLVGYLLKAISAAELAELERRLAEDAELRGQLEVLRLGLAPLEADRQPIEPPPGLALRACERVRQARVGEREENA